MRINNLPNLSVYISFEKTLSPVWTVWPQSEAVSFSLSLRLAPRPQLSIWLSCRSNSSFFKRHQPFSQTLTQLWSFFPESQSSGSICRQSGATLLLCPFMPLLRVASGERRRLCPVLIAPLMGLRLSRLTLAPAPSSRVP